MTDTKMNFFEQIWNTVDKAAAGMFAICPLMANIGGLLSSRRRLLIVVIQPAIMTDALNTAKYNSEELCESFRLISMLQSGSLYSSEKEGEIRKI